MPDSLTRIILSTLFLVAFALASGLLVWIAWNGVARSIVEIPYIPFLRCIAIAFIIDFTLGTLALCTGGQKKTFAFFQI